MKKAFPALLALLCACLALLIATDVGYDDGNRLNKMLYLYRRKSE